MALLDYESFDKENNCTLSNWWNYGGVNPTSADGTGVFGYGRYHGAAFYMGRNFAANQTVIWIQGHVWQNSPGNNSVDPMCGFKDPAGNQFGWSIASDLKAYFVLGTSTFPASATVPSIALQAWTFFQFRVAIGNAGSAELWMNGSLVLSYTGDTQNSANAYADSWYISNTANANRWDNIVVYNESGNAPNARTAETRIYHDLAIGAGSASAWTPSAGANWQNVDEQPNDGDTTYNSAAAAGLDDLYAFPAASVPGGTIYAVGNEYDVRKDDAGANAVDALIGVGGTAYAKGTPNTLSNTLQRFKATWDVNPATGIAWTVAQANAAQVGVRRTT